VRLDTGNIRGAFEDLRKGITYDNFVRKYPQAVTENEILVVLNERRGYQVAGNAIYCNITMTDHYYWSAGRIILPTDEDYRPIADTLHDHGSGGRERGSMAIACLDMLRRWHWTSAGDGSMRWLIISIGLHPGFTPCISLVWLPRRGTGLSFCRRKCRWQSILRGGIPSYPTDVAQLFFAGVGGVEHRSRRYSPGK
jgi:hypothetical protein